jgi:hypothetical protein
MNHRQGGRVIAPIVNAIRGLLAQQRSGRAI